MMSFVACQRSHLIFEAFNVFFVTVRSCFVQVCRVAYELMQVDNGDASTWFKSLDDVFYFGGQTNNPWTAIQDHVPVRPEEIELKVGLRDQRTQVDATPGGMRTCDCLLCLYFM